jgi:hypothetical protein
MSYSQEIYDAVRSKIIGGDIGSVIEQVARDSFDISFRAESVAQEYISAAMEQQRPSVLFKPEIMKDGNSWIALLGDNLAIGVVGCGDTPSAAMADFDRVFYGKPRKEVV